MEGEREGEELGELFSCSESSNLLRGLASMIYIYYTNGVLMAHTG